MGVLGNSQPVARGARAPPTPPSSIVGDLLESLSFFFFFLSLIFIPSKRTSLKAFFFFSPYSPITPRAQIIIISPPSFTVHPLVYTIIICIVPRSNTARVRPCSVVFEHTDFGGFSSNLHFFCKRRRHATTCSHVALRFYRSHVQYYKLL